MTARKVTNGAFYTIGYEGRTPSELVRNLKEHGIRRLVDVRLQPMSRVKGFSLMSLFEHLRKAGIAYEHMGELGNPPEIRALFHEGQLVEGRKQFRRQLKDGRRATVDLLVGLAHLEPTAILCRERDVSNCHRAVVAEVVGERSPESLKVIHL